MNTKNGRNFKTLLLNGKCTVKMEKKYKNNFLAIVADAGEKISL